MTAPKTRPGARRPRPTAWHQAAPGLPCLRAKRVDERRAQESLAAVRSAKAIRAAAADVADVALEIGRLALELGRGRLSEIARLLELEADLLLPPDERGAA